MTITNVEFSIYLKMWKIELEHGLLTKFTNKYPPYKIGDEIVSVWHFDNYCNTILK